MRKAWTIAFACSLTALSACAGSSTTTDTAASTAPPTTAAAATPTCTASGSAISITALPNAALKFDKNCLAVPAGKDFTVTFDNQDSGVPHSFAILLSHTSSQIFYSTGQVTGPNKMTYTVAISKLPGPGTYHFHCEVHPDQMNGTFIVQ
jgi:plastocyanin